MNIKTECVNEACGRTLLVEDFEPGIPVTCPFCGERFTPPPPEGPKVAIAPTPARPPEAVKRDLGLAANLRGDVAPPPAQPKVVMKRPAQPGKTNPKPSTAARPKVPGAGSATMIAKAIPVPAAAGKPESGKPAPAKPPAALVLPSQTPTKPDLTGFEVIEEDDATPMMAIPVEPPPAPAKPAAPAPAKLLQPPPKPASAPPGVVQAILIEDEEPVMDA